MKITTKTTKEQLKNFLGANVRAVKKMDKDLFDQIAYADKVSKADDSKVTRKDLMDLARAVMKLLGDKCVEPALAQETPATPVVENSVKKLSKGSSKKQETKKTESPKVEEDSEEEEKKTTKKPLNGKKKTAPKKEGVTPLPDSSEKAIQMAKVFPKTLDIDGTNYELATNIQSMDDLYEALNNEEEIVFAYYWTKRHLKQFPYFMGWLGQPKSFDNDLDLTTALFVSEEKKVAYTISMYTDAMYTILPEDIPEVDGVRLSCGIEFQIYRPV